jgi:hypothetical protein
MNKSGKYAMMFMGGKISAAELDSYRADSAVVEKPGHAKLPLGYELGWSRTNGGFGAKADTIARQHRENGGFSSGNR